MRTFGILLISCVILVVFVTGFMCFLLPFDALTTHLHLMFAMLMVLATVWHIAERRKPFTRALFKPTTDKAGKKTLWPYSAVLVVVLIAVLSILESGIVPSLASLSYEGRHKNTIFRARPDVVYQDVGDTVAVIKDGELGLELDVDLRPADDDQETYMVIWAESGNGDIIETLFLSESLRYSDELKIGDQQVTRTQVLPIWSHKRNRKGIDADKQKVDGLSAATIMYSLSLNTVLKDDLNGFHIKMEVNRPGDENDSFSPNNANELLQTPPGLGQPSVLYSIYLDLQDDHLDTYFLLKYEGHGAPMGDDGLVTFGHEGLTSARRMVKKALVGVQFPEQ